MGVRRDIASWLEEHEDKVYYARLNDKDLLRLVRLRVWAFRHRVDMDELLTLILPHLRRTLGTLETDVKRFGLGCTIASLTGNTAERILIEALRQKYPDGEWLADWREREIDHQLSVEMEEDLGGLKPKIRGPMNVLDAESSEAFIASYRKRIIATRNRLHTAFSDPKRQMPYRHNPFL